MSAQPIVTNFFHVDARVGVAGAAFAPMRGDDLDEVAAIEQTIYSAPWSHGNFADSLRAGYCAWVLRARSDMQSDTLQSASPETLIGYFVLMAAVDEAHLLNVSVATEWQHRGFGLALLEKTVEIASDHRAGAVILEVRPSNLRALAVYRRFGFSKIGVRQRYYPASVANAAEQQMREDALVMRLVL